MPQALGAGNQGDQAVYGLVRAGERDVPSAARALCAAGRAGGGRDRAPAEIARHDPLQMLVLRAGHARRQRGPRARHAAGPSAAGHPADLRPRARNVSIQYDSERMATYETANDPLDPSALRAAAGRLRHRGADTRRNAHPRAGGGGHADADARPAEHPAVYGRPALCRGLPRLSGADGSGLLPADVFRRPGTTNTPHLKQKLLSHRNLP